MKFHLYRFLFAIVCVFFILPLKNATAQYCTSGLYVQACSDDDYIDDFYLGSINQTATGCASDGTGYSDYTGLSTTLQQGSTYTMMFSVGSIDDYISAWIDFNDNGTFEPTEEIVSNFHCISNFQDYSVNFTLASNATPGDHRMRVRDAYNIQNMDPCAVYTYGEVHDYTAHVTAGVLMTFESCTALQQENSACSPGSLNEKILEIKVTTSGSNSPFNALSFSYNTNGTSDFATDVTNVKIYASGSDSVFSTNLLFGSANTSSGVIAGLQQLNPGDNFFWMTYDVSPTAMGGDFLDGECTSVKMSGGVGSETPTVTAPSGFTIINTYCTGDFVNRCTSDDYINNLTFYTLSNQGTGCNGQAFNYILYNPIGSLTTAVQLGKSYPFTVQSGPDFDEGFGVWIDYNNNGNFNDPGEFVFSTSKPDTTLFTGNITIPTDTSDMGLRRMRVRCTYDTTLTANDNCSVLVYGETEDYLINIVSSAPCSGVPDAGTVQSDVSKFCGAGNAATLTVTGSTIADGIIIQWQQSQDDISWNNIQNATSDVYITDALNQTTYFRVKVSCSASGQFSFSNEVTITVIIPPGPPIATGDSSCGAGALQLTAIGTGTLKWYDSQTGGNLVGTGSPFIIPFQDVTATYWVEDNLSGCAGLRSSALALIYHPQIKAFADNDSICTGEIATLMAENTGHGNFNYQWAPIVPGMIPADGKSAVITVPLTATTLFTLTADEDSHQCDTSINVDVTVNALPIVSLSGLDTMYFNNSKPDTLTGTPSGGTFSGPGMNGNIFDPAVAGIGGPYEIIYTYTDANGCTGSDTMITVVRLFIGISNPSESLQCSIFPNPASETFSIKVNDAGVHDVYISVTSVIGQIMREEKISAVHQEVLKTFDVHEWPKGTYFVEITAGDQLIRNKLIIQ